MKRTFFLVIFMTMIFQVFGQTVGTKFTFDSLSYEITTKQILPEPGVTGKIGECKCLGFAFALYPKQPACLTIPSQVTHKFPGLSSVNTYYVSEIAPEAFNGTYENNKNIKEVYFPNDNIREKLLIGEGAFRNCKLLTKVSTELKASKATITLGKDVFKNCTALIEIQLYNKIYSSEEISQLVGVPMTPVINPTNDVIQIYPNPITDHFQIKGLTSTSHLTLLDLNGRVLSEQNVENEELISVSTLPKGIYIVKLVNDSEIITRKISKR